MKQQAKGVASDHPLCVISLPEWGLSAPLVIDRERGYFPLPAMCRALGLSDVQTQRQKIAEHAVLSTMLRRFSVPTRGGVQETWCLERRAIGFWLGTINLGKVKPELREGLLAFQWRLVDLIDQALRGGSGVVELDTPANLARFARSLEERIGRLEDLTGDEE